MSRKSTWRSEIDRREFMNAAEPPQSRPQIEPAEVQAVGAAAWTFGGGQAIGDDEATDAIAHLLRTAELLRSVGPLDVSGEAGRSCRRNPSRRLWVPSAILLAVLGLLLTTRPTARPSQLDEFHSLLGLHQTVIEARRQRRASSDDATSRKVSRAAREIAARLESAAQVTPVLSLQTSDVDADGLLARRELLSAARDLERLANEDDGSCVVERQFRKRMARAAVLLRENGDLIVPER